MTSPAILLVEDEVQLQRSIERALRHLGATVFAVRTAHDAAQILADQEIDAVIADVGLGTGQPDGVRILASARTLRPRAVRVLMSGTRTDAVAAALADGVAEQFCHKPFGLAEVTEIVAEARKRSGLQ